MALTQVWTQVALGDTAVLYSGSDLRQIVSALGSDGVGSTSDLLVTQRAAGANFTVDVSAGRAVVTAGAASNYLGSYVVTNTAAVNVTIPAAPPSGTRIHRVVLHCYDKTVDGGTSYGPVVEVLADTGSGTPATPASALSLALVTVQSTTVSITNGLIADTRALSYPVNRGPAVRTTWPLTADAANVGTLAPLTLLKDSSGRVTVEGAYKYTTGQGATSSRALVSIPSTHLAKTNRGLMEFATTFYGDVLGSAAVPGRIEFNSATGAVTLFASNIQWSAGNDWISLHGMTWMTD